MPNLYFVLFELIIYVQLALCLGHALKHGLPHLLRLLSGIVFGLLLELLTIQQLHAYQYGEFLLMISNVPLCIAVAWGCIIYSAMEFSDSTSLPRWARPLLDGLLALTLDLALDSVAIRLGFWDWGQGTAFQFFGVPFANYLAWFWVASSFSGGYRLLAARRPHSLQWLAGPLGILFGLVVVLSTNAFMAFMIPPYNHIYLAILIPVLAIIVLLSLQPRLHERQVPAVATIVPLLTFTYILVAGFVSEIFLQSPDLLAISLAALGLFLAVDWQALRHLLMIRPRLPQHYTS